MRPYIDSEDSFYTHYDVDVRKPIIQKPTKKKDDSIITKKDTCNIRNSCSSKDCCFTIMDLTGLMLAMDNKNPLALEEIK